MEAPRRVPGVGPVLEALLALVLGAVLAVLLRRPGDLDSTVPADLGDPLLQAWQLGWGGYALRTGRDVWDANVIAPLDNTLAFSDSLLGYAPTGLVGSGTADALVRYNLVFLATYALLFAGTWVLVRQLGLSRGAALVAGLALAFSPWRLSQSGHLQVLSSGGIPLCLAMLARGHGLTRRRTGPWRPGWVLAGWLTGLWQVSLGFGLGLQTLYLLGALSAGALVRVAWTRALPPRRIVLADAVGVVVLLAGSALLSLPYAQAVADHPQARRDLATVAVFAPQWSGLLAAPPTSATWGERTAERLAQQPAAPEGALFPGLLVVVLAVIALLLPGPWSRGRRTVAAGSVVTLCAFALGTNGPLGGWLYEQLNAHAPGWQGVRTPGRLVTSAWLALALLAACGVDALRRVLPDRGGPVLVAVLALTVTWEGRSLVENPAPRQPPTSVRLADLPQPVMVLPSDYIADLTTMWWSTDGYPRMVNGTSGFVPTITDELRAAAGALPAPQAVAVLRGAGVRSLVLVRDQLPGSPQEGLDQVPTGLPTTSYDEVVVVDLR